MSSVPADGSCHGQVSCLRIPTRCLILLGCILSEQTKWWNPWGPYLKYHYCLFNDALSNVMTWLQIVRWLVSDELKRMLLELAMAWFEGLVLVFARNDWGKPRQHSKWPVTESWLEPGTNRMQSGMDIGLCHRVWLVWEPAETDNNVTNNYSDVLQCHTE
jgi:hypothetical protein